MKNLITKILKPMRTTLLKTGSMAEINGQGKTSACKKILPWVAAFLILGYLFYRIDMRQFFIAFSTAKLYLFWPALLIFIVAGYLLDSQNLTVILREFNHKATFREMLGIRGITYLLMVINYSLGLGGIIYYFKQNFGIPLVRCISLMIFYNQLSAISLFVLGLIGCLLVPGSALITNALIYFLSSIAILLGSILIAKILPGKGILLKVKNLDVVKIFAETKWTGYFYLVFWRFVYFSTFIFFFYFGVRAFHMEISLASMFFFGSVIVIISSMPFTPFGLGTVQAAMLYFFKDYSSEPNIMAFGITYSTSLVLFRGLIGLLYMNKFAELIPVKD
jgi:uncharacterized membrane protein YbhN (UPF0104 family)